jgi:hypothetical protein
MEWTPPTSSSRWSWRRRLRSTSPAELGVVTRAELIEQSGARDWSDRGFRAALRRGVAEQAIKELGDGLFEVGPDVPDLDEGRFDPT